MRLGVAGRNEARFGEGEGYQPEYLAWENALSLPCGRGTTLPRPMDACPHASQAGICVPGQGGSPPTPTITWP